MQNSNSKARIIEASIDIFLDKGYDAATIRDICARAQVNIAAVNYYFGSKDALRTAVLESIMTDCNKSYPIQENLSEATSPEERLRRCIHNLLRLVFPADPINAHRSRLFWLEMGNPSPSMLLLVNRFMEPIKAILENVIQEIVGATDADTLRLCVGSIVGQQIFHAQDMLVLDQLYPTTTYRPVDMKRLEEHVYRFSLAGLRALQNQNTPVGPQ